MVAKPLACAMIDRTRFDWLRFGATTSFVHVRTQCMRSSFAAWLRSHSHVHRSIGIGSRLPGNPWMGKVAKKKLSRDSQEGHSPCKGLIPVRSASCRSWDSRDRWGMLRHSPIPNRILMCCASLEYPLLGFPRSAAQTEVRPSGPAGI